MHLILRFECLLKMLQYLSVHVPVVLEPLTLLMNSTDVPRWQNEMWHDSNVSICQYKQIVTSKTPQLLSLTTPCQT